MPRQGNIDKQWRRKAEVFISLSVLFAFFYFYFIPPPLLARDTTGAARVLTWVHLVGGLVCLCGLYVHTTRTNVQGEMFHCASSLQ